MNVKFIIAWRSTSTSLTHCLNFDKLFPVIKNKWNEKGDTKNWWTHQKSVNNVTSECHAKRDYTFDMRLGASVYWTLRHKKEDAKLLLANFLSTNSIRKWQLRKENTNQMNLMKEIALLICATAETQWVVPGAALKFRETIPKSTALDIDTDNSCREQTHSTSLRIFKLFCWNRFINNFFCVFAGPPNDSTSIITGLSRAIIVRWIRNRSDTTVTAIATYT